MSCTRVTTGLAWTGPVIDRRQGHLAGDSWPWRNEHQQPRCDNPRPGIGLSPQRWWLVGGFVFAVLIVGLTNLAPVLLLPLFYRLKPLERESLQLRLVELAGVQSGRLCRSHVLLLGRAR